MKKFITVLLILVTFYSYSQKDTTQLSEKYKTSKSHLRWQIKNFGYNNPSDAINHYGTQLRNGRKWQLYGLGLTTLGTSLIYLSPDEYEVNYIILGSGIISLMVGNIIIWDSAKHLKISTNGKGIVINF